ncbi:integrase family protein [uncultured Kiloniella sp.]|uniref:tyrosine-type recombinase/integrase n=1 Tax=uncultured Kiloniella sp. TaxID=1133091 RepID=UPI002611BDB2|nr:integrase family protein [uncultured Kiloniella sp.]
MKKKLNDKLIKSARSKDGKRLDLTDTDVRGLCFRVAVSGKKSFSLRYQDRHGRGQRITLGNYPDLTLSAARTKAREILIDIFNGIDPKRDHRDKMVSDVYSSYKDLHISKLVKSKDTDAIWKNHILPALGNKKIAKLTRPEIADFLQEKLRGTSTKAGLTTQVNRIHEQLSSMLNDCVSLGIIVFNPIAGMKKLYKETPKTRFADNDELIKVWKAAETFRYPHRHIIQMILLNGQRRDEVRRMRFSDVNFKSNEWFNPATNSKTNLPNRLKLSDLSMEILKDARKNVAAKVISLEEKKQNKLITNKTEIKKILEESTFYNDGFCFTHSLNIAYNGMGRLNAKRMKFSGVQHLTNHDIRRTLRTNMSKLKIDYQVAEAVIGHKKRGNHRVYDQWEFYDEKGDALQKYSDYIKELTKYNNIEPVNNSVYLLKLNMVRQSLVKNNHKVI